MDKLNFKTKDGIDVNLEKLSQVFPEAITETKDENGNIKRVADFEKLKMILGDAAADEIAQEFYEFTWPGKREAIMEAAKATTKTLRPCVEESKNWDTTQNLYIEGDNLEVLKLLQESYLGKVKMIYIDPPYNTGKDFVYRDNFHKSAEEGKEDEIERDEETNDNLFQNTESNGRFHSDWCSMIYPRLKLARDLLSDDGVIFISIDDNEVHNLRKICDEIFGESNFIAQLVWKRKTGAGTAIKHVFSEHEYILTYSKNKLRLDSWRILNETDGTFKNPDEDPRGDWNSCALTAPSKNKNPNQLYMIEVHYNSLHDVIDEECVNSFVYDGHLICIKKWEGEESYTKYDEANDIAYFVRRWAYSIQNIEKIFADRKVYLNKGNIPRLKKFKTEYEGKAIKSIYYNEFSTQQGSYVVSNIFDGNLFEYPKPIELLRFLISLPSHANDTVLDFFSGSATTAHACMQLNAEDDGNRKFIMVQLPEVCAPDSEAAKMGYKNICEIGKERIRRAGDKIKADHATTAPNLDIGFRVLKLAESNMKDVYYSPNETSQDLLSTLESNIKEDRNDLDLLFACLIDWGVELSLPLKTEEINGVKVYTVNDGEVPDLIACFAKDIPETTIREIAKRKPLRVVFRDSSFADSPSKINVAEIFKTFSPNTTIKVL